MTHQHASHDHRVQENGHEHPPQQPALLGLLDGRPLPRTELDRRLAALRGGPRSSALPVRGSAEDRQLRRWVAQVILTEELCTAEAAGRGLDVEAAPPVRLDQRAAVELGSITAAAFEGSAAVRALYEAVTAEVTVTPEEVAGYRAATARPAQGSLWRIVTPDGEFEADPQTLPDALATALRSVEPGQQVVVGEWTAALAGERRAGPTETDPKPQLLAAARRTTFVRWLDHARAHRLQLIPGLEHPGDPAQPDNHHRH